jgi:anti-sigma regulatory factor (Ser/Thr protein kinase)
MTVTETSDRQTHPPRFRHEALFYAGLDEFVNACFGFIRSGLDAGEPTLVVALAHKLDALREALGPDAASVSFGDMAAVGANPARIIPAWRAFVDRNAALGARLRGIGEPIFPARSAEELVECERHEALLNLAFAGTRGFWLVCPYDTDALPPPVIAEARRNHPLLSERGEHTVSPAYRGEAAIAAPFAAPLGRPPAEAPELPFGAQDLERARRFVAEHAAAAGLERNRMLELVVAANEIASNCVKHGGGHGRMVVWREPGRVVCEVRGPGTLADPLADRRLPDPDDPTGRGLWLANQLCDLVQIRSVRGELVVRLHVAL